MKKPTIDVVADRNARVDRAIADAIEPIVTDVLDRARQAAREGQELDARAERARTCARIASIRTNA